MTDKGTQSDDATSVDTDVNRHPSPRKVLQAVAQHGKMDRLQVDRIEIGVGANGEVTYRYRPVGAEDYDFATIPPE